jgi:hypothetical protein
MNLSGSEYGPVTDSYGHGNEPSGSIRVNEFSSVWNDYNKSKHD